MERIRFQNDYGFLEISCTLLKNKNNCIYKTFRHDTSRNLDPALHTHSVIANMVNGPDGKGDGKWRTMANERLYGSKMLLGALYRSELGKLDYGIEKTHADGRFEIAGVGRHIIDAFSTRRAEVEAAMEARGLGGTADNQHLARRAALMTRAHKRDVDKGELRESWQRQASGLGFDAHALAASAMERSHDGAGMSRNVAENGGRGAGWDPEFGAAAGTNGNPVHDFVPLFAHAEAKSDPAQEAVDWALAPSFGAPSRSATSRAI